MRRLRSRWIWRAAAVLIVMLEGVIPQRALAQWHAEMLPGVRFGPPLRASAALGVAFGNRMAGSPFAGPMAVGDVGIGGVRASAGYLFAGPFASGIELLGSAMRTWGAPAQLERNQTLAGAELRVSYFLVNAGLGVFRPVAGFTADHRTRFYLNVGLGI